MVLVKFSKASLTLLGLIVSIGLLFSPNGYAQSGNSESKGLGGNAGSGTVLPDLFTGTMSYTVPIEVPPGRKGIAPDLALTYSSGNRNGWVGIGWGLEVESVERNTQNGVNYSGDDYILHMAGATVDLINTAPGEYRAKNEGAFARIKKLTAADGKPYWEVTDRSGTRSLFGQTASSRQDNPSDANQIFKWSLDRVEDVNGNFMTFSYTKDQGQIYPDRVDYTGHGATAPTHYVKFYLETRSDAPDLYSPGFRVKTASRLKTIDIFGNGNRVRTYKLAYKPGGSTTTGRSLLESVQQFGKDATVDAGGNITNELSASKLPAISFGWQVGGSGFAPTTSSGTIDSGQVEGRAWVDFNADGKADYCRAIGTTDLVDSKLACTIGGSFSTEYVSGVLDWGASADRWWTDFNGDGASDFCRTVDVFSVTIYISCTLSNKTAFGSELPSMGVGAGENEAWVDFNGDGKMDFCRAGYYPDPTPPNMVSCTVSAGNGFGATYESGIIDLGNDRFWTDFNGDGKTDFCRVVTGPALRCILSTGTGFGAEYTSGVIDPGSLQGSAWADFNGDGKADFCRVITGPYLRCTLSTGTGFSAIEYTSGLIGSGTAARTWADVNGDGMADFCHFDTGGRYSLQCEMSTGNGFGPGYTSTGSELLGQLAGQAWPDFNGDGKEDFCRVVPEGAGPHHLECTTENPPVADLLTSISNGLGGITTIGYTSSTQWTNTLLPFPVEAVTSVTTNDGNGGISTTNYSYSGGYYYMPERDFRGFHYAKITGPSGPNSEQSISETWFHQGNDTAVDLNDPNVSVGYMKGKPYRVRVTDGLGRIFSEGTTSYLSTSDYAFGNTAPPYFNPAKQVDAFTYDGDPSAKQTKVVYTC